MIGDNYFSPIHDRPKNTKKKLFQFISLLIPLCGEKKLLDMNEWLENFCHTQSDLISHNLLGNS